MANMTMSLSRSCRRPGGGGLSCGAVLRGLLTTTVLVVLYYVLPYRSLNGDTALRLLAGLVIFVGITVWQVKAITGSAIRP